MGNPPYPLSNDANHQTLDNQVSHNQAANSQFIWSPTEAPIALDPRAIAMIAQEVRATVHIVRDPANGQLGLGIGGTLTNSATATDGYECIGMVPPIYPEWLGDRSFTEIHGVRFPYVAGAMARGIASVDLVKAMAAADMLAFLGTAGLSLADIEAAVARLQRELAPGAAWGCNLIHTPERPDLEAAIVDCYLDSGVTRVSASAFTQVTPALATFAYKGIYRDGAGQIIRNNYIFAKISRPETATAFLNPAPLGMVEILREHGFLTAEEASLAAELPIAEDITVEANSGGHTDQQTLTAIFPSVVAVRDQAMATHGYSRPIRIGAAGGLGTPAAVAAAFSLGAAYVLTGSVNQSSCEAGISEAVKALLAQAKVGDVAMAPSADMFEAGVKVQVLKRGTMYASRARKLYDLYTAYKGVDEMPAAVRAQVEAEIFHQPLDAVWQQTEGFFNQLAPDEIAKANADPKHKMALIFRWYLGKSSQWPIEGNKDRLVDYQVWCGPAMASFNDWVQGTILEPVENRHVVQIARNLLEGATRITRAHQLRTCGVPLPASSFSYQPEWL